MNDLIEVRSEILQRINRLPAERLPLPRAIGRTVAEDILSGDSIPPFDNTAMDGFALRHRDSASASPEHNITLNVTAIVEAGTAELPQLNAGEAARIYTGAPIPPGADCVIPFEHTESYDDATVQLSQPVPDGHSIRRAGDDLRRGDVAVAAGTRLNPAGIGLLATVGCSEVPVVRRPRVAVHSSGNELIPVTEPLTPGKIRNSNLYSICARLERWGADVLPRPVLIDTPEAVRKGLLETLEQKPDAIVTTGGVSAGDLDYIRDVARELGSDVQVRRVNMKPGKPLVDGTIGGVPFFGLPGNPAACLVSFEVFVRPALAQMEGRDDGALPRRAARVMTQQPIRGAGRLQFLRARVTFDDNAGEYQLQPMAGQGSHLLSSFADANCLVEVSAEQKQLEAGATVAVWLLDQGTA
ncbi:MAG: gephyrin-like molybdotransferase Glp [Planctomycetota bacterium]